MGCNGSKSAGIVPNLHLPTLPLPTADPYNFTDFDKTKLESLIQDIQDYNCRALRKQMYDDTLGFILNQLLYSFQFFESLEKAKQEAEDIKIEKETKLNRTLIENHDVGIVGGDRRITLMSAMGEVLARSYVYDPKGPGSAGKNTDPFAQSKRGRIEPTSFQCEGILPMDFYINYENFEIHLARVPDNTEENDYALSKCQLPVFKFVMEVPDKKNQIPQGYIRILADNEQDRRDSVEFIGTIGTPENYGYSNASELYADRASEAKTSYPSSLVSEEDTESMVNMKSGDKLLHRLEKVIQARRPAALSPALARNNRFSSGDDNQVGDATERFNEGVMPVNYPTPYTKPFSRPNLEEIYESENAPKIKIEPPSYSPPASPMHSTTEPNGFLSPSRSGRRLASSRRTPTAGSKNGENKNGDPMTSSRIPPQTPEQSSGYDSMSATSSSAQSNIPMLALPFSASIRRRALELKLLRMFHYQLSPLIEPGSHKISPDALIKCKIEKDVLEDSDDETESHSSEDEANIQKEPNFHVKTYLSSTKLSASALSDFDKIAMKLGLPAQTVDEAQVLGATIRCCVPSPSDTNYKVLHTFTPTLQCKRWPEAYKQEFKERLQRIAYFWNGEHVTPALLTWPSESQITAILEKGCRTIPQGFYSTQFFNSKQSLEWLLTFPHAESILLGSFQHAHWHAYIISAILLRAFIFTYGPLGVGLEHIRSIMFQLCNEEFLWNEQEIGDKLTLILQRLDESLSRPKLPSFFLAASNMMKSTARENTLFVKSRLKAVRENLIIHCLSSLENLKRIHPEDRAFPFPDLRDLNRLLTLPEAELFLAGINKGLRDLAPDPNNNSSPSHLETEDAFRELMQPYQGPDADLRIKEDKIQRRLRKAWKKYQDEQNNRARKAAEINEKARPKIAKKEKKTDSIDVEVQPVSSFTHKRLVPILGFFIKQFLQMAERAIHLEAFAEALGYTLHVQNLCQLLQDMRLQGTNMFEWEVREFENEAHKLRQRLEANNSDYVRAKIAHIKLPNESSMALFGAPPDSMTQQSNNVSNFELRPRLPTPPHTAERVNIKRFPKADFARTVQEFARSDQQTPFDDDYDEEFLPDLSERRRSRGDKLLFVDNSNHERSSDHTPIHNSKRQSYDFTEPEPGPSSSMFHN